LLEILGLGHTTVTLMHTIPLADSKCTLTPVLLSRVTISKIFIEILELWTEISNSTTSDYNQISDLASHEENFREDFVSKDRPISKTQRYLSITYHIRGFYQSIEKSLDQALLSYYDEFQDLDNEIFAGYKRSLKG
jgi:hypothetical protein